MQFESLSPELQAWFRQSIDRGSTQDSMAQLMRTAGYASHFAEEAVASAVAKLRPASSGADDAAVAIPSVQAQSQISSSEALSQSANTVEAADRKVDILFALNAPRVMLFGGLLAPEECEQLIELSRVKLARSAVLNAHTGAFDVDPGRTSSDTHFQRGENELIARIEKRIAELIGCPVENGEPIQILHYLPGGEYKPHFDFFDPAFAGNEPVLAMGGQRTATLIMYLNNVEAGGSTGFPNLGLDVLPRQGNALYFAYTSDDGQLDRRTLHAGSPVAAGEKWIATKWLRQRAYG